MNIEKRVKRAKIVKILLFSIGPIMLFSNLIVCIIISACNYSDNFIWLYSGIGTLLGLAITLITLSYGDIIINLDYNILHNHKLQHPEEYYGDNVFKVNLFSVTEDMIFTYKKDRFPDNAKFKCMDYCFVQKTYNPNFVREIVSGILIPVSKIYWDSEVLHGNLINYINPVCVVDNHSFCGSSSWPNHLKETFVECGLNEVNEYIKERKDGYKGFETFEQYLEDIFSKGKEIYLNKEKEYNEIQQLVKK